VGIGTSSPAVKLHVINNSATAYNPSTAAFNTILSITNTTSGASTNALMVFSTESNGEWYIGGVQNAGNTAADFVWASRASGPRAERMRILSDGNVGIGTSSPASKLDVSGQVTATGGIFKANGAPSLSAATAGEAILAPEGTYGALLYGRGSTYDVVIGQRSTNVALAVVAATNNIYTGGNIGLTTTPTTSGTGITFPATQSASSDANTLDDYEEGTFTATVVAGGTFSNLSEGRYTKIGRQVFVMLNPSTTAITGNIEFSGLPFAVSAARSALVTATAPPSGVTYAPLFVDSTSIYINVTGTYSGGAHSTYFAAVYQTS
jgi:hypothetical protein